MKDKKTTKTRLGATKGKDRDSTNKQNLLYGKYSIKDLVDLKELREIFEHFCSVTGSIIGFVSYPSQEILIATGWRDICTKFHRVNPESAKCCLKSNISMTSKLKKAGDIVIEPCENGLIDAGTPIIIKGKHIATLATGQVFFKKPDIKRFKKQAKKFNYDVDKYLEAVSKIPIVSRKQFKGVLSFLGKIAMIVTELGLDNLEIKEKALRLEEEIAQRRKAEQMKRESEERYRVFVENFPGLAFQGNFYFKPTLFQGEIEEITGYTEEEFVKGKLTWDKVVHPEDLPNLRKESEKIHKIPNYSVERDYRIIRKDGRMRWVHEDIRNICDEFGKPFMVQGIITDITERKNSEEALHLSESRYRGIFENSPISLWEEDFSEVKKYFEQLRASGVKNFREYFDANPEELNRCAAMIKIVDVNDFTLQLYKAKSKEELTQSLGKVFTPESYQTFKEELIVLANGQFVFEGEALQKALDGKAFSVYIKVTVAPDHEKTLSKVFASIIDITEIKKAEQSIRDNEERYRKLVELSPDGIAVNVDGKAAFINTAGARMLGANSVDEIIGRAVSDFVCPASLKRVNESIAQILENGVSMKLKEEDFMRLDRITINVELSAVPITYQGKKAIQIIFRDITERKKAEGSLIEANRKIELYKRLVEFSGDGIYRYSFEEGRIIFANQGLVDILDLDCQPKELEGKLLKDVLIYTEKPGTLRKAVEGKGELRNFEYHFKTLKGQDRWVIHNSFLFDDPLGGEKTVESIVKDITKRKQTEEEIKKLYKELLKSNQRLKQLVVRDSQTGLYNYRFLTDVIEREFYRAKRYAYPFSIIMLDIDYFKSINDAYGHQFGDLVLKQLAKELKRFVRRYDIVIRYGGEEFIVISPATDRTSAVSLAQRILDALNLCNFGNRKHTIKLKLSMVAVSYPEDKVIEGMDLIKLADHVLNKVKESGGNKLYSSMDIKEVAVQEESNDIKFLRTKISKLTKRANQNLSEAIFAFAKTLEVKDHYTGEHVENTVFYATEVAKELGLSKEEAELVKQAATLHDLGKVGISEKILLKKSKLTKKEFNEIKKHPQYGADILRPIQFLHGIIPFIFYHHERWDGKGYPSGIKGSEIPLGARIIAIADVYQALTSDRPYRKAYPKKEAVKIIKRESGAQFDPAVVDAFLKVLR